MADKKDDDIGIGLGLLFIVLGGIGLGLALISNDPGTVHYTVGGDFDNAQFGLISLLMLFGGIICLIIGIIDELKKRRSSHKPLIPKKVGIIALSIIIILALAFIVMNSNIIPESPHLITYGQTNDIDIYHTDADERFVIDLLIKVGDAAMQNTQFHETSPGEALRDLVFYEGDDEVIDISDAEDVSLNLIFYDANAKSISEIPITAGKLKVDEGFDTISIKYDSGTKTDASLIPTDANYAELHMIMEPKNINPEAESHYYKYDLAFPLEITYHDK